jgi:hypothetical protein
LISALFRFRLRGGCELELDVLAFGAAFFVRRGREGFSVGVFGRDAGVFGLDSFNDGLLRGGALTERLRGRSELLDDAPMDRLEATRFGGREIAGKGEGLEIEERAPNLEQPGLEDLGTGRSGERGAGGGSHPGERLAEERAPIRFVRGAIGVQEYRRLATAQTVALDRARERVLILRRKRREQPGERGTELAAGEQLRRVCAETRRQLVTARDPRGSTSEQRGDRTHRQAVFGDQGANDGGFVERGQRPRRRIRREHEPLQLQDGAGALDDRGDDASALLPPPLEPLEAVDDFKATVVHRRDPDRQLGRELGARPRAPGTKRGVARAEPRDRQQDDVAARERLGVGRDRRRRRRRRSSGHERGPGHESVSSRGSSPGRTNQKGGSSSGTEPSRR